MKEKMGWVSWGPRLVSLFAMVCTVSGIGANWGTQATHPLPSDTVVKLMKDNGIQKVKLFDANYDTLRALGGSGIEVMVGIPNEMLASLAGSIEAAEKWVEKNVSSHMRSNVKISCVSVGNEPFLKTYNGSYLQTTYPALVNVYSALSNAGLGNQVKVTVPLNADVYESSTGLPSGGDFRTDIHGLMLKIVEFLSEKGSPFTVNIYPFISLYSDANFPVEYAFFDGNSSPVNDGGMVYSNMFDPNHDALVHALQKNGYGNLPIIVGEIGWPTDGDRNANSEYARRFNQGFMNHISGGKGTPMRPGSIDAYIFSLIDEDAKSIDPGNFERHWGIFTFDGLPKYTLILGTTNSGAPLVRAADVRYLQKKWCVMDLSAKLDDPQLAPSVSYACGLADCTSLGYGTTCGNLDARGNISYAFNSYFQKNNQRDEACKFPNLSTMTKTDPSDETCRFEIMIQPYHAGAEQRFGSLSLASVLILILLTAL
ncbi:hypothetical protein SLA2020_035380 [Shorea laevis]